MIRGAVTAALAIALSPMYVAFCWAVIVGFCVAALLMTPYIVIKQLLGLRTRVKR